MKNLSYELRILGVFAILLAAYLALAWGVFEPMGYYGTLEQPRFADPWISRAETILQGGKLYQDVFTSTPPLMNYLLIPPTVVSGWFGHWNPGATLSFMIYFSLFNLLIAYVLLYMAEKKAEGFRWAMYFLFNPLTFGNAVLRRQDESVLVFFFALALWFMMRDRHICSAMVMGLSLLVKLTGGMLIPPAFLNTRDWRYLVLPFVAFSLVFAPFFLSAGEAAIFWDLRQQHTEHPFQFGGVSLTTLWVRGHGGGGGDILRANAVVFLLGVLLVLIGIAWKPQGMLEDLTLLVTTVLVLSPKLHCGYFSILSLPLVTLLHKPRLRVAYFVFGTLAIVADLYKWPIENFTLAFWLMVVVIFVLILVMLELRRPLQREAI
jgi:hypothetical protein